MLVPRNQRQAAAMGFAATAAPTFAPLIRDGVRGAFNYMTSAPATTQKIQQILRASHEPKNVDTIATAGLTGTGTPVFILLNATTQGVTGNSRSGRQVVGQSLTINLKFETDPTSLQDDVVRVTIVRDKESRGAAPVTADIFANNSTVDYLQVSDFNFDNVPSRFQVLHDEQVLVPNRTSPTTTTSNLTRVVRRFKTRLNFKTHYYNTSAGNITDIDDGSIYLILSSTTPTKVSSYWVFARYVFRDI